VPNPRNPNPIELSTNPSLSVAARLMHLSQIPRGTDSYPMEPGKAKQTSRKSRQKDRHHPYPGKVARYAPSEDTVPGVQKIKSSLRQARRLLAKENLAANVRVETERKIKALEADLIKAQNARQERAMAVKYHKVKFFGVYSYLARLHSSFT